jgi:hypothetical protein
LLRAYPANARDSVESSDRCFVIGTDSQSALSVRRLRT